MRELSSWEARMRRQSNWGARMRRQSSWYGAHAHSVAIQPGTVQQVRALPRPDVQVSTMFSTCVFLISMLIAGQATVYLPLIREEQLLTDDTLLRELINQMGNELVDVADSYLGYQEKPKEVPLELPMDYDGIDTLNPNPSIRDQEYLQHSTLWSHQRTSESDKVNDQPKVKPGLKGAKDEKENTLPAYCTPPNPCPVGYTSENNCLVNFENTAAFSREYQSAQDCMCDTEHMLDCSVETPNSNSLSGMRLSNTNFDQIVEEFQEGNPFFRGEKLPIAAKKGTNVIN